MRLPNRLEKIVRDTRLDFQTAMENARDRLSGQGQAFGFAALLVIMSFLILAIIAPIALKMSGLVSYLLGFIPFIALCFGLYIALKGLWRLLRVDETQNSGAIAKSAIEIALSEAIDTGLVEEGATFSDCFSGNVGGFAFASFKTMRMNFCVIRLKSELSTILVANPMGAEWPVKLPTNRKLAPITPDSDIALEAWSFDNLMARDKAQNLLNILTPALKMAQMGGELPYICAQERSLVLGWKRADIGAIALIGNEVAHSLAREIG